MNTDFFILKDSLYRHQVGPFIIFEYINKANISLIYIAVTNPKVLPAFSLTIKNSFMQDGIKYYLINEPSKTFKDFISNNIKYDLYFETEILNLFHHDVDTAISFCHYLILKHL